jgi:hypothetical protein
MNFLTLLILTIFFYCIIPVIIRLISKKGFSKKISIIIAILNATFIWTMFTYINYIMFEKNEIANIYVAFFWGIITIEILLSKEAQEKELEELK